MKLFNYLLIFTTFLSLQVMASPSISFESSVDKALASTDDEIVFRLDLSHPKGETVNIPDIGDTIEGFRVIDFGEDPVEKINEIIKKSRWYKLQADISGTYKLPSVEINHNNENYKTSEIFLEINNNPEEKNKTSENDIRDIKGIYKLPVSYFWIIILSALLFVFVGLYFMYRKIKKGKVKPEIIIPPDELALSRLKKICDLDINHTEQAKLFSFGLSEIIRDYFEAIYNFPASDRTTEEFKKEISTFDACKTNYKDTIINILLQTDKIKFTDTQLDDELKRSLLGNAHSFIEETRPKSEKLTAAEDDII